LIKFINFIINGATIDYAPPEVLANFLVPDNKSNKDNYLVSINPIRADIYAMGKTCLQCLTRTFTEEEMVKKFYNLDISKGMIAAMEERVVKKDILDSVNLILKLRADMIRAQFYIENNNLFVSNVLKYVDPYVRATTEQYQKVMEFIALFVKTNPLERPSPKELETKANDIMFTGSTIRMDEKMQISQSNNENEIISFEKTEKIINDLELKKFSFYYPRVLDGTKATSTEANPITASPEMQFEIGKNKSEFAGYNDLSKFVHCIVGRSTRALLYSIGGVENGDATNKVSLRKDGAFEPITPLTTARYEFGVATWPNHIAVAGGKGTLDYLMDNKVCIIDTIEIFTADANGKGTWETYPTKMSEPRSCCAMCFFDNALYVMGGIKECSEEVQTDPMPEILPFNSTRIDVFFMSNKTSRTINIITPLTNSLADCACIPINKGEIIILRDFLFKDDPLKEGEMLDFKRMTQNKLTIKNDNTAVIDHISASTEADFATINTGYDTCNVLSFKNDEYVIIPDFISQLPAEQEPEVLMYDSKKKMFSSILMKDPSFVHKELIPIQEDQPQGE